MSSHNRRKDVQLIDFMGWMTGDAGGRGRGGKGRAGDRSSRKSSGGHRRLQQQYEARRISGFTADEVDEFRQIFEFYDIDNSKMMDLGDLEMALRALGYNPHQDEVETLVSLMDVDGDPTIDFSEFCMLVEYIKEERGEYGELREAFRCLDHNDDGMVQVDDLITMMTTHGEEMSLKEINEMIRFGNKDKSGSIDYEQFVRVIRESNRHFLRQDAAKKLLKNFIVSTNRSSVPCNDTLKPCTTPSPSGSKRPSQSKRNSGHNEGSSQPVETIDTLIKAIGGPILMTSAIIVTASMKRKKPKKWPSIQRVLGLRNKSRPSLWNRSMFGKGEPVNTSRTQVYP